MRRTELSCLIFAAMLTIGACTSILGDDFVVDEGSAGAGGQVGGGGTGGTGGTGGGGTTATGGQGASSTGDGPQLVGSTPANGETDASLIPFGQLFFDRPVNVTQAAGKVSVQSSAGGAPEIAQVEACTDSNPNCVRFVVPTALTVSSRLPGGTTFTVVVDRTFPDPDGGTNDADASVSYTTFTYDPAFYTGLMLNDELGGIVYVDQVGASTINALYVTGKGSLNFNGPEIERLDLDGAGQPTGRENVAGPNFFSLGSCNNDWDVAYGLDRYEAELYLSASYCDAVVGFDIDPSTGDLTQAGSWHTTVFGSPDDKLYRVESVVVAPDNTSELYYFSSGTFGSGPQVTGILQYRPFYMVPWGLWVERTGLFDGAPDFYLAGADEAGTFVIYVANGDTIVKLNEDDSGAELNRHTITGKSYASPGMRTDSAGRLYVGDDQSLVVYDTSGFNGFTELAVREGLDFRRFDVREDGSTVHVYFADFRGSGDIRELEISF